MQEFQAFRRLLPRIGVQMEASHEMSSKTPLLTTYPENHMDLAGRHTSQERVLLCPGSLLFCRAIIILCLCLPQFVIFSGCIRYQGIVATLLDNRPIVEDEYRYRKDTS